MSGELPAGFLTIEEAKPPPEPETEPSYSYERGGNIDYESITFPRHFETGAPEELAAKQYGCSGSLATTRYNEATKFRDMLSMDWADARVALNRLVAGLGEYSYRRHQATTRDLVALAEFALTAQDFNFLGKKGDSAPKLRKELADAVTRYLRSPLARQLQGSVNNTILTAPPIARFVNEQMLERWPANDALRTMVPMPDGGYVRIIESTPDEVLASVDYVRRWLADREQQRAFATGVSARLACGVVTRERDGQTVTAKEFAAAISIADALKFMSDKLAALYLGITHSIPLCRLYPATPEREAIELWWPWGRAMPLVDGGPAKAPMTRKKVLDPAIITTTRPQDVVREVIERTGINRTTAQRMTADMRADMRRKWKALALSLLCKGETRAGVARAVGLSPSRISAMFKNQKFPTKKSKRADNPPDDDDVYDDEEGEGEDVQVG